jgi:hypothetical protein
MASVWALKQECFILENGVPLTVPQLSDAKLAGVVYPERVRLLRIEQIPFPEDQELREVAEAMQLMTPPTPGMALRYGIYIRSEHWARRWLVVHELAHTAQYERLGSIPAFLECYLYQCLSVGYTAAPMEQEAITAADRICGPDQSFRMPRVAFPSLRPP